MADRPTNKLTDLSGHREVTLPIIGGGYFAPKIVQTFTRNGGNCFECFPTWSRTGSARTACQKANISMSGDKLDMFQDLPKIE